jgi:ribosomal protein L32
VRVRTAHWRVDPARVGALPACPVTRKLSFDSRRHARGWMRKHGDGPERTAIHVYRCPHCGAWHLTSQDRRPAPSPSKASS